MAVAVKATCERDACSADWCENDSRHIGIGDKFEMFIPVGDRQAQVQQVLSGSNQIRCVGIARTARIGGAISDQPARDIFPDKMGGVVGLVDGPDRISRIAFDKYQPY